MSDQTAAALLFVSPFLTLAAAFAAVEAARVVREVRR